MGYSWYRVDSAFVRHPKTLALKTELKEPLADAYVNRLWAWAQLYSPSGRFDAALVAGLESELGWTGSSGSLAAALEKTGWIDRVGDEFEVHDWSDLQSFHAKKARKDADKKRKRRARANVRTPRGQSADKADASAPTAPPTDVTDGRDGRTERTNVVRPNVRVTLSPADAFWVRMSDARKAAGHVPEDPPNPRALSSWWSSVMLKLNGDEARVWLAFERFMADAFWAGQGSRFHKFQEHLPKYASDHYGKPMPAKGAAPESDWSGYQPGDTLKGLGGGA